MAKRIGTHEMRKCDHVGAAVYTSSDGKTKICYRCGNDIETPPPRSPAPEKYITSDDRDADLSPDAERDPDTPDIEELDILGGEPGHHLARNSDPATSKAAAWMNPGRRNSQRYRLAVAFYEHPEPMTWDQAYTVAGVQGASQRITELRNRGIIEIVGTDATSRGAAGQTYQLTTAGRAMMQP